MVFTFFHNKKLQPLTKKEGMRSAVFQSNPGDQDQGPQENPDLIKVPQGIATLFPETERSLSSAASGLFHKQTNKKKNAT